MTEFYSTQRGKSDKYTKILSINMYSQNAINSHFYSPTPWHTPLLPRTYNDTYTMHKGVMHALKCSQFMFSSITISCSKSRDQRKSYFTFSLFLFSSPFRFFNLLSPQSLIHVLHLYHTYFSILSFFTLKSYCLLFLPLFWSLHLSFDLFICLFFSLHCYFSTCNYYFFI